MKLYDRYMAGEGGRTIYHDIYELGEKAFDTEHFDDVVKVLTETFERVAFNIQIIYAELKAAGYVFIDSPILTPLPDTANLLAKLEKAVSTFGFVPYSLKLFYEIVGSVDFGWDYNRAPDIIWPLADPLQIINLEGLVTEVTDDTWVEYLTETLTDYPGQYSSLELAADYLHKDNISGGEAYAIQITPNRSIDSLLLNEPHGVMFIEYLRICMENCGFAKIDDGHYSKGFFALREKVYPQLKMI